MATLVPFGNSGLDDILGGGLPANRLYLVQGDPGVGKTTLALQFLLHGASRGERVLYITLSETQQELEEVAASHGWSLASIGLFELTAAQQDLALSEQNTLIHPAEIELREITQTLLNEVERINPTRVVFDSLSEVRLLAQDQLRFRRQILTLKQYFAGRHCTVLLLDDLTSEGKDSQLQSLAHGVILLEQLAPEYGTDRRRMRVAKLRGVRFRGGHHDFTIKPGGLHIFPRLVAAEHRTDFEPAKLSSKVPGLDSLLGGGLDYGTSTLIVGPAGTGKSSIMAHFADSAAASGKKAAIFVFDENPSSLRTRSKDLGLDLESHIESRNITVKQVDPAEMSPGEFVALVRHAVEHDGVRCVAIDTLNGYLHAMPAEKYLTIQLHELLSYLSVHGVTTILVMAQHGFLGGSMSSPLDVSYLSDAVIMLRYFEFHGQVRKSISVVKKRTGAHEDTIREFSLGRGGLKIGKPLSDFRGVLAGTPEFFGDANQLLEPRDQDA